MEVAAAVVEPDHRRTAERPPAEVADVEVEAAVPVHISGRCRVGEVVELRDVRRSVHELPVRGREHKRVVEPGRVWGSLSTAISVVDIWSPVVIEVSDNQATTTLRPRDRTHEQRTPTGDEATLAPVESEL